MEDTSQNEGCWAGRFYIESLGAAGGRLELAGREVAHVSGSRRARIGDTVTLFDGSGWDVNAEIVEAGRGCLVLSEISRRLVGPPLAVGVVCAAALPKGAREDEMVSQCAQLGVARLVPLEFERSVVKPLANWSRRAGRLRRLAIEAAKQSGASTIMHVDPPETFAAFLARRSRAPKLICVPGAAESAIAALQSRWPFRELSFVVGPEGGFTPEEAAAAAAAGLVPVRLAATILRIETAATAFAAVAAAFLAGRKPPA
jgi:16S rRNA (uracil1498-N3)-methyltransferase